MKVQHKWLLSTAIFFHLVFCQQTDVSNIVPTELSQYIQLGTLSYQYKTIELTSYVYLWQEINGLKNILADHFLLMVCKWCHKKHYYANYEQFFLMIFMVIQSVSVPNLKSFGQMKAEL